MLTRRRVREWLEERFFLRIHMTLILLGTFLAGIVTTRVLMLAGLNVLALRYAIAVALAYLVFLVLVKLWLMYVGSDGHSPFDVGDVADVVLDNPARAASVQLRGGGSGPSLDLDVDLGDDLGGIVLMVVIIAVVVLLGGIAIYFIYTAPALLGEAAFEAVLAASIARRARKAETSGWIGAVWRATVWPFLAVLLLAMVLGWVAQWRCPEALRLRDAVRCAASDDLAPSARSVVVLPTSLAPRAGDLARLHGEGEVSQRATNEPDDSGGTRDLDVLLGIIRTRAGMSHCRGVEPPLSDASTAYASCRISRGCVFA